MFNFFDNQQSPFPFMPNTENQNAGGTMNVAAMQFVQQTWVMQMQMMQTMCMMPMYMMQGMAAMLGQGFRVADEKSASGQTSGFKLGNMEIPPELLGMLLKMDMSPENLEKLQKVLDFVFEAMPESKSAAPAEGNEQE